MYVWLVKSDLNDYTLILHQSYTSRLYTKDVLYLATLKQKLIFNNDLSAVRAKYFGFNHTPNRPNFMYFSLDFPLYSLEFARKIIFQKRYKIFRKIK